MKLLIKDLEVDIGAQSTADQHNCWVTVCITCVFCHVGRFCFRVGGFLSKTGGSASGRNHRVRKKEESAEAGKTCQRLIDTPALSDNVQSTSGIQIKLLNSSLDGSNNFDAELDLLDFSSDPIQRRR